MKTKPLNQENIAQETTTTIYRGRPRSNYFVLPVAIPGQSPQIGSDVVAINPRTNEKIQARCHDYFTYLWDELPDSFCLLNYGITKGKLRVALEEKFPEFRGKNMVRFLMLEAKEADNRNKD